MTATAAPAKTTRWWIILVEGILAIILGLFLLASPVKTAAALTLALGIYWIIIGILDLVSLFRDRTAWGWRLFIGIIALLAGLVIVSGFIGNDRPLAEALATTAAVGVAFAWVIGFMAVIYGIVALIAAFRGGGWGAAIMGVLGILFGLLILGNTLIAAASLPIALGILFIFGGIFMLVVAFRMR
ncbi:MAG: DUF308 domain-containing protein [Anaerolineae bacterium]|nr:DUF308 domain-containing protein [Anaerolineae bacterium]MCB0244360.1 DUF308 domain-containing protein [Anaerolineae bacterium]MCB0248126.1 DUF308 domain-containing protein [Anaerolineae bacterium]MCB9129343.1 DUF308 domain-containing protein [Anaerolineales bacterium]MCO5242644.1 DUF308 domain-containing protein [Anaerolineae bacterium]